MGLVTLPSFGSDPATITAAGLDGKVDPLATEFNGNIENANIKSAAGIVYSKLTLTDSILNADINTNAQIAASKIDLSPVAQQIAMSGANVDYAKGADIPSATTTDIGASTGNVVDVTGTTTITALGTIQAGAIRFVQFDGILTLTHHATSLILPTGANITTAAGDWAVFQSEGSGNWRCINYSRASGASLLNVAATQSEVESASSTSVYVSPGRAQYHPGMAKAWMHFNGKNTPTATVSHNMGTITDNGAGDYTIAITTDFSSAFYAVAGWCGDTDGSGGVVTVTTTASTPLAAGSIRIGTRNFSGTLSDFDNVSIILFGDQA
jgi:hypothetical protein